MHSFIHGKSAATTGVHFNVSQVCSAFNVCAIGTKVVNSDDFLDRLRTMVVSADFGSLGQKYINFPGGRDYVLGGLARRSRVTPETLCVRRHRGNFGVYASRAIAEEPDKLGVVVYTVAGYLNDPEVDHSEILDRGTTHAIVAVLSMPAGVGGDGVMGTYRFTSNLASGNNKYKPENGYTLDKAISDAKLCLEYENTWITVAD